MKRTALALGFAGCIALAGCRTTGVGEAIEIPIPHNLSDQHAQHLVTRFVDRGQARTTRTPDDVLLRELFAGVQRRGSIARRYRGRWRIEAWQPGSAVAAYAWKRHVLRVEMEFRNRSAILRIGECTNLRQSPTEIHKTANALASELAQDIRFLFGKIASGDARLVAAARSLGAPQSAFCEVVWASDERQRAECRQAQRSAYNRLRAQIDRVEVDPSSPDSRKLKMCYAEAQTRAGTDWEATERCLHTYPASLR
jgi:hypothetical protein